MSLLSLIVTTGWRPISTQGFAPWSGWLPNKKPGSPNCFVALRRLQNSRRVAVLRLMNALLLAFILHGVFSQTGRASKKCIESLPHHPHDLGYDFNPNVPGMLGQVPVR